MQKPQVVIMAAGLASRYGGSKQTAGMGPHGELLLEYSACDAIRAGFDRVVFLIKRENLEQFRETIGHRIEKKVRAEYAFQDLDRIPECCLGQAVNSVFVRGIILYHLFYNRAVFVPVVPKLLGYAPDGTDLIPELLRESPVVHGCPENAAMEDDIL